MGASQSKLSVATLNYSGIYLSPFEYYSIDNWQELEVIGRIFQMNLKRRYDEMKGHQENDTEMNKPYKRQTFRWDIGDIDKNIQKERYSPLYRKQSGIKQVKHYLSKLLTKEEFFTTWDDQFAKFKNQANKKKNYKQPTKNQCQQCKFFDFLCYESILEYLYTKRQNSLKDLMINPDFDFNLMIKNENDNTKGNRLPKLYQKLMIDYFQTIDEAQKMRITKKNLFFSRDHKLDIIFLVEVNGELRKELDGMGRYYMYGPFMKETNKQCILMVRKTLEFISPDYSSKKAEADARQLKYWKRNQVVKTIFAKTRFDTAKITQELIEKIKEINEQTIKVTMDKYLNDRSKAQKEILRILEQPQKDPLIMQIQENFHRYIQRFKQYYMKIIQKQRQQLKDKDMRQILSCLQNLKERGMQFCTTTGTFAIFDHNNSKIVLASLHLSSNPNKNRIQVLLLGILICFLEQKRYKYILGGDFNSYISVDDEFEPQYNLFDFMKKQDQKLVSDITEKIQIFPKHPKMITTKKKRTIMQPQTRKANELVEKCVDQIITNLSILYKDSHVGQIEEIYQQKHTTNSFLPHKKHPFDHLLVYAKIDPSGLRNANLKSNPS